MKQTKKTNKTITSNIQSMHDVKQQICEYIVYYKYINKENFHTIL